jgi:hypothetical protein
MTELQQAISHLEQMDAHRAEFLRQFAACEVKLRANGANDKCVAQVRAAKWRQYRETVINDPALAQRDGMASRVTRFASVSRVAP